MKIEVQDGVLSIRDLKEINGKADLCHQICRLLPRQLRAIELDLSQTEFLNCSGLGELIALQKLSLQHCGKRTVRLLHPPAPVEQLFELTRLQSLFEIQK